MQALPFYIFLPKLLKSVKYTSFLKPEVNEADAVVPPFVSGMRVILGGLKVVERRGFLKEQRGSYVVALALLEVMRTHHIP